MLIKIFGKTDEDYINKVLKTASKLINIPKDVEIYFIDDLDFCSCIILSKAMQNQIRQNCKIKTSFSFIFKKRKLIAIYLEKNLQKDKKSLVGLLLHETAHINQMQKGVYRKILNDYSKVSEKNLKLIRKLKYDKKGLTNLFYRISTTAILTLKDIYANNFLISNGLVNYLLYYYKLQFNRRICPKPFFYKLLKQAAKKDMSIVSDVIDFQLAILSATLPLYRTKKAEEFIRFIEKCYQVNIQEISSKCEELITLYFNEFNKKGFNEKFFNLLFLKVYNLLK